MSSWSSAARAGRYARGGWARLIFPYPFYFQPLPKVIKPGTVKPGTTRASTKRDAVKIVTHLRYGAAAPPLVFPAQFTNLPGRWQVAGTLYVPYRQVLRVRTYTLNAAPAAGARDVDAGLTFQNNLPSVEIDPVSTRHNPCFFFKARKGDPRKSVRQTINGYHVIITHEAGNRTVQGGHVYHTPPRQDLCAGNAGGLAVHLSEHGAHPPISVDGLFKDHLRLLGTDPANWTTKPIG